MGVSFSGLVLTFSGQEVGEVGKNVYLCNRKEKQYEKVDFTEYGEALCEVGWW
jgi:hypothetical protein